MSKLKRIGFGISAVTIPVLGYAAWSYYSPKNSLKGEIDRYKATHPRPTNLDSKTNDIAVFANFKRDPVTKDWDLTSPFRVVLDGKLFEAHDGSNKKIFTGLEVQDIQMEKVAGKNLLDTEKINYQTMINGTSEISKQPDEETDSFSSKFPLDPQSEYSTSISKLNVWKEYGQFYAKVEIRDEARKYQMRFFYFLNKEGTGAVSENEYQNIRKLWTSNIAILANQHVKQNNEFITQREDLK